MEDFSLILINIQYCTVAQFIESPQGSRQSFEPGIYLQLAGVLTSICSFLLLSDATPQYCNVKRLKNIF
jgi:hypothetical protein